jgi:hypothetical protein
LEQVSTNKNKAKQSQKVFISTATSNGIPVSAVCVSVTQSLIHFKTEVFTCVPGPKTQRCVRRKTAVVCYF